jgi:serine/threonine protein kinase
MHTIAKKIENAQNKVKYYLYNPLDEKKNEKKKFYKEKFKYKILLGVGTFGTVLLSDYITDDTTYCYAVKCMPKSSCININKIIEEVIILKILDHPLIIKLEGTFQTRNLLCIVTEPLLYGDLYMVIYDIMNEAIPSNLIMFYISSLIIVMDYIHSKGIIYRDLKPENIMLDANGYIKLIDLGLAKRIRYVNEYTTNNDVIIEFADEKTYTLCGTPEYICPENILKIGYNKSVDIWALGILLYEMFMKKTPFDANNITQLFKNILNVLKIPFSLNKTDKKKIANEDVENLLIELLSGTPINRIGMKCNTSDIFNHKIFNDSKEMINCINNRMYIHEYIPDIIDDSLYQKISFPPVVPLYTGDNSIFDNF